MCCQLQAPGACAAVAQPLLAHVAQGPAHPDGGLRGRREGATPTQPQLLTATVKHKPSEPSSEVALGL